jgi:Skp family chaperone for outer membrane proteins
VEDISNTATTQHPQAARDAEMRTKLDQMVKNCANTLEDLDSATKKYREGAEQDKDEDYGSDKQSSLTRTAKLKRRLASNITKVQWDMDKDTLKVYREKLQTHTDAINLVLNTFLWYSFRLPSNKQYVTR